MSPPPDALRIEDLVLAFAAPILSVPAFALPHGPSLGIAGPSGTGKTTFLHALAGLERPRAGRVLWHGTDIWSLRPAALDRWRRETVGLVFQDMHLIDGMSARANVLLPLRFDHATVPAPLAARAAELLDRLGIAAARPVTVLSRGERQRVAIARALLRRPALILADEPTASLDPANAAAIGTLLAEAAAASGATLVIASHDPALLARTDRRIAIAGGTLEPTP